MNNSENDRLDLVEYARILWKERRLIVKITSAFIIIGLIVAFTTKPEYDSSCKLMPESQEGMGSDLGGFGGLAGLAGINLDLGNSGSLTPELYPEISKSTPFLHKLINTPVYFEGADTTVSSFVYLKEISKPSLLSFVKEYTIGLPWKIKSLFEKTDDAVTQNNPELLRYSKDDWAIMTQFSNRLSVSVDPESGIINVQTKMPDTFASAKIASMVVDELTERVTNYKLEKIKTNLEFVQNRFDETKAEYQEKQRQLANYTDRNRNVSNSLVNTEYERLQNEVNIAFEVYKGLATQLEQAKIRVKEETPVFTILEPVKIPVEKSGMRKSVLLVLFTILGVAAGSAFVLFWEPTLNLIKQITENS